MEEQYIYLEGEYLKLEEKIKNIIYELSADMLHLEIKNNAEEIIKHYKNSIDEISMEKDNLFSQVRYLCWDYKDDHSKDIDYIEKASKYDNLWGNLRYAEANCISMNVLYDYYINKYSNQK